MISSAVSTLRMWFAVFLLDAKILSFLEIGACRVGTSISLCVGLCHVGPLLVGHSFRWRFLIGMGGGVVVRCLSVLHILCLCSWVCHVGTFISSEIFDWHLWCVHGDKSIFHGTSLIPFSFIELSPPDPNMSTYLDR